MYTSFADIVANNYDEIKRNFKAGLKDRGYEWDEDLLNDAFISCNSALKDKPISKTEALKYFWTSYINKFKSKQSKKKPEESIEDYDVDPICPVYNQEIDKLYKAIVSAVQDEYGLRKAYIWELYVCEGKSAKEIKAMGFIRYGVGGGLADVHTHDNYIYLIDGKGNNATFHGIKGTHNYGGPYVICTEHTAASWANYKPTAKPESSETTGSEETKP